MSAIEDAMGTATEQYYTALTTGCGLDSSQFQLGQGAITLGTDSAGLWRFFDSMPPASVNNYFQASGLNSFSNSYFNLINNLIPPTDDAQQAALGDKYVAWQQYQASNALTVTDWSDRAAIRKAQIARFNQWAYNVSGGLDSTTIDTMQTLMDETNLVTTALNQLLAAKNGKGYAYTANYTGLTRAFNTGQPKNFIMDTKTQDVKINKKFAKANVSGKYWFVTASANAEWEHTIENIHKDGIKMEVAFKKLATLEGGPYGLATPMNPDLTGYTPWYNSGTLNAARNQNDNRLWKHSPPTWEGTFGPNGNMQRATTALIVVDGVTSTLKSTATVQKSDQEKFKAAAKLGVYPWFQAEGSGGWENKADFNQDGTFTITSGNPKEGNPVVLGVLVKDIQDAFN